MRSPGWVLIQFDWCPSKKGRFGRVRRCQGGAHEGRPREGATGSRRQAPRGGLGRAQRCRPWAAAPELSLGACRSCRHASEASTSTAVRPRPVQRHIRGIRRVALFRQRPRGGVRDSPASGAPRSRPGLRGRPRRVGAPSHFCFADGAKLL